MAKKGKGKSGAFVGPLYAGPDGYELGPHKVEGPTSGLSPKDTIGFLHVKTGGKVPEGRTQSHDKE